jgi:hypothetical protein
MTNTSLACWNEITRRREEAKVASKEDWAHLEDEDGLSLSRTDGTFVLRARSDEFLLDEEEESLSVSLLRDERLDFISPLLLLLALLSL